MRRREALKTLTGIFGTVVVLPAWAEKWDHPAVTAPSLLTKDQKQVLTDLVGAIIPETDTPGAAELNVQYFVERMVQDCFEQPVQARLSSGLDRLNQEALTKSKRSFSRLTQDQKLALIKDWSSRVESEEQTFLSTVKNLTIQGYLSSEYVMTNVSRYELVPARYHGCVDIGS